MKSIRELRNSNYGLEQVEQQHRDACEGHVRHLSSWTHSVFEEMGWGGGGAGSVFTEHGPYYDLDGDEVALMCAMALTLVDDVEGV